MRNSNHTKRRYRKEHKHNFSKLIVIAAAVALVTVCSIVGVMANTIPCTVIDGEESYSFYLMGTDTDDILAKAEEEGMEPVTERDRILRSEKDGTVTVYRAQDVSVNVDGEFTNIVAYYGDTVGEALEANEIRYPETAELNPTEETVIVSDMAVTVKTCREVTVKADGKTQKVKVEGTTVADALKAAGVTVGKQDKVSPSATSALRSGMTVTVTRGYQVTIADGETEKNLVVYGDTVGEALKDAKITLSEEDRVEPAAEEKIQNGTKITVIRVEFEESTEREEIPYETVYEDTDTLYEGETQVKTAGTAGEKEVVYRDLYENGEFVERKAVSETVITEPVNEVVLRGTMVDESGSSDSGMDWSDEGSGENTFIDYNGNVVSYSSMLTGSATAYCIPGGTTSIGLPVGVGIVAVNPDIIPYGTKLYIASDDFVYGYAIAGDTGGALMAGEALVDVYYDTLEECYNFGRRDMNVYILS